jgi:alanyl-tRNA synthetase
MTSAQIRQSFLDFFAEKQHTLTPSSSLMPDAPNLLFTNAGMNQFVPIFLGERTPDVNRWPGVIPASAQRAADTQKCIRAGGKHNDLEDVGLDTYHQTLFEMLGNWSFGDYFKKEAIAWAWELVVDRWKFPANRLYATVYQPGPGDPASADDEAREVWTQLFRKARLDPAIHVVNGNKKDNFWMMGDTGPCGPCSELHVDLTPEGDTKGSLVNAGDARCIEIWNLVFIQFNATADGRFDPLPARHVDTGMGFERVCSIIQGTRHFSDFKNCKISNYETDVFRPILSEIEKLTSLTYRSTLPAHGALPAPGAESQDVAFRVIADHIRTLTFAICDGIRPSNTGRGFVLRRILRRAVRYGRSLGLTSAFFHKLVPVVVREFGTVFPELRENEAVAVQVIRSEEESFLATLGRGLELFEKATLRLQDRQVPGDVAFELWDTYGFPLDLTELLAREKNMTLDTAGFGRCMEEQRTRSQAAHKKEIIEVDSGELANLPPTLFVGYEQRECTTRAIASRHGALVLEQTSFYAEMGGQVGDTGTVEIKGTPFQITDTRKVGPGIVAHRLEKEIDLPSGTEVTLRVNPERRHRIEAHHSATHLMHWALRQLLGSGVGQKGSFVGPDRLRFDFSHGEGLTAEQVATVEEEVNAKIKADLPVQWQERPYAEVKNDPTILQFFGEKYGENVRVVDIGGFSKELCGGTHVRSTGQIGFFKIVSEGAIAAGVRRIEAVCGPAVVEFVAHERTKQQERLNALQKKKADLPLPASFSLAPPTLPEEAWTAHATRETQLAALEESVREGDKEARKKAEADAQKRGAELAHSLMTEHPGAKAVVVSVPEADNKLLQSVVDSWKGQHPGALILAGVLSDRVVLLAWVPPALQDRIKAGDIIRQIAPLVGGKGGGRPDLAQGGGNRIEGVSEALDKARSLVASL